MAVTTKETKPPMAPTTPVLISAARHIASRCSAYNKAFLDCKRALGDPEKCLEQGSGVIECVHSLLKELHDSCGKELDAFTGCMDWHSRDLEMCRDQQKVFEAACPI